MSTIPRTLSAVPVPFASTQASIGDPDGTRTVTSIVVLLVAIGIALLLLAVWIYRTTRPDPELLAPLEVMGERSWRRGDPVWQRRRLDELRPAEAKPLAPSVAPPELDASFDEGPSAPGFDDLRADASRPSGEVPVVEPPTAEPSASTEPSESGPDESEVGSGAVEAEVEAPDSESDVERDDTDEADEADEAAEAGEDAREVDAGEDARGVDAGAGSPSDATPSGVAGPTIDLLLDDDFDPEALAAAREQLERELAEARREVADQHQLDVFERDSTA